MILSFCLTPQESGCTLFAALSQEDLIYSQPHEPVDLKPFLSLNPKKLCLDLRLGRPSALLAGQLLDKVAAHLAADPIHAGRSEKRTKGNEPLGRHRPAQP